MIEIKKRPFPNRNISENTIFVLESFFASKSTSFEETAGYWFID